MNVGQDPEARDELAALAGLDDDIEHDPEAWDELNAQLRDYWRSQGVGDPDG